MVANFWLQNNIGGLIFHHKMLVFESSAMQWWPTYYPPSHNSISSNLQSEKLPILQTPDNCQTTISTFSPKIKLQMSLPHHHQLSMSLKVAIFQHIISHSIYTVIISTATKTFANIFH